MPHKRDIITQILVKMLLVLKGSSSQEKKCIEIWNILFLVFSKTILVYKWNVYDKMTKSMLLG